MLGQTIPCFDTYGFKTGFEPERPWLFQDFDLIQFEQVSEQEMDTLLLKFKSGLYEWQWEHAEFDMAEHNRMLEETASDLKQIRARQAEVQEKMMALEKESLAKWREEKAKGKVDEGTVDQLLTGESPVTTVRFHPYVPILMMSITDPAITVIEAPTASNVWKVQVSEGDEISAKQTVSILEAMKLEINVDVPDSVKTARVEKVLVKPGDVVKAGDRIALLRLSS